jgi:hypothetical protein
MLNDSRVVFPDGIGALIVESDERFLRSAALMLSLLNYRGTVAFFPCFPSDLLYLFALFMPVSLLSLTVSYGLKDEDVSFNIYG